MLLITISLFLRAQIPDTIRIIDKNPEKLLKNLRIKDLTRGGFNFWQEDFTGHWAGLDFGINGINGLADGFPEYDIFHSNSMYINIIQQSIRLQRTRNTIGLVTGVGYHAKSFRLNNSTTVEKKPSGEIVQKTLLFDSNQKSKFSMSYLTAPMLIEFQIPVNHYANRIFVSGGMFGAYRLSSHTKIKYRLDRKREKLKTPGDFSLHDFRYGVMVRFGYRQYQVFCTYDLQPLFREEAMIPELHPVTFGVTLLSF